MNPILLDIPMPIRTPRLLIRPRHAGEGPIVAQAIKESLEHLKPWMPFAQQQPIVENVEAHCRQALSEYIARTNFTLSIYDKTGKVFIGSTGLHQPKWDIPSFHIGYWIHKNFEGQGMIQESTNAITRFAFSFFKARRVEIRCDSRNTRSLAVMTKLGYQQEGVLRNEAIGADGVLRDTIVTARYNLENLPALDVTWG